MLRGVLLAIFSMIVGYTHAQKVDSFLVKNGIEKPNSISAHHFGLFHLRINQNFQERPVEKTSLQITIESANSFHPFLEAYFPKDPLERARLSQLIWYQRDFHFIDQETTPAEYSNIHIDAVFKVFRFHLKTRISNRHELSFTLRTFMPTKGKYPFSFLTNDESIEWFHSNIAGGEDPFGRRFYGMNQMIISYQDRNNKTLNLKDNQFIFGGIEINHFYYPSIFKATKNMYMNFGSHLGINTSKYNPSLDLGMSANLIKKWILKNQNEFRFGFGASAMKKRLLEYGSPIDFGNNHWMASIETNLEFTKFTQKGNYHSFSLNYQIQTRYNKKEEKGYYQLLGDWQSIHSGWQHGVSTLYHNLTIWTAFYTYARKNYSLSLYLKEDLKVNNAPDVQTGISLRIPIAK